jgi:hypothetical protein
MISYSPASWSCAAWRWHLVNARLMTGSELVSVRRCISTGSTSWNWRCTHNRIFFLRRVFRHLKGNENCQHHQLLIMQVQRSKCRYVGGLTHFHPFISFFATVATLAFLSVSSGIGASRPDLRSGEKEKRGYIRNQKRFPPSPRGIRGKNSFDGDRNA